MARKSRFSKAAATIGAAVGRADRTAHKLAKAGVVAKKELEDISKEVESLKRRLLKASKRLKKAMA
jgi:predicted  nucleic acid-binding Zn-ribbon protein